MPVTTRSGDQELRERTIVVSKLEIEQNLLLVMLALQNGLIEHADLVAAFQSWSKERQRPLVRILVERGALTEEELALLEGLARGHVKKHGGDHGRSLVGMGVSLTVAAVLAEVADPALTAAMPVLWSGEDQPERLDQEERSATLVLPGPPAAPPEDKDGTDLVGMRFRILRPFAGGGLGLVSVALDSELHREVALKEIRPELADDPQNRARFLREAQITGRLEHPGVVPIYGLGTDAEGRPFYAMRLVHGESLKEAIVRFHAKASRSAGAASDRVLERRRLLTRFVAVCEVVAYAHSRGVIHRDLKPSNILLGPYGETMVVDWGLAKAMGRDEPPSSESADEPPPPNPAIVPGGAETLAGSVIGTPSYMSPEQAEGSVGSLGPPGDVYSLGATLYHLLVGRPPFWDADANSILERVRRGEVAAPRSVNPAIPRPLDEVCLKAMAFRPEDRYDSSRRLAEDIERWLADEPIPWIRESWGTRISRWARRNRMLMRAGAVAMALVSLVSLIAAIQINASREQEHEQRVEALRQTSLADDQRRRAEERNLELQRLSARIELDEGLAMCEQGDLARGILHLGRSLELMPPDSPELERLIRTCLVGWADRLITLRAQLATGGKVRAVLSRDGTRVATASDDHTARVWDGATGRPLTPPLEHDDEVNQAAFSPDGARIVTAANDGSARIWDVGTGRLVIPPLVHRGAVNDAEFSPDGTRVITASDDRTAQVWDAATGRLVGLPLRHGDEVIRAAFSPDGARVATASKDGTARLWDATTGQPRTGCLKHGGWVTGVAFSPDGARLITTSADGTARVWDTASGEPLGSPLIHQARVNQAAYSPDGRKILTASDDFSARIWDATTGRPLTPPLMHRGVVFAGAFSRDGTLVATASQDHTARIWDVATGRPRGSPMEHREWVYSAEFSPDGGRILTAARDSTARIWDLAIRPVASPILRHPARVQAAAYSRDGTRIATACIDGKVRIWRVADGRLLEPMIAHRGGARTAVFSPDGTRIVTAGNDGTARLWDATTGRPLGAALTHLATVNSAIFSPDGARIVTASHDGMARVWDATTGRILEPALVHPKWVWSAVFSPDGTRILTACGDRMARIWDARTLRMVGAPLVHNSEVWWAAFSPDGARIVTASQENVARVWDASSGELMGPRAEHDGLIHSVLFSPDGTRIVTASEDRTARVWDGTSGRALGPPLEHGEVVWWATFSPDGTHILTASGDHTARVWPLSRPMEVEPRRIADWLSDRTGLALDERGGTIVLDGPAWEAARGRLESGEQ